MTNYIKKKKSKRIFNYGCCSLLLRFRWERISFKSVCTLTRNNILFCSLQIAFRARPVWRRASYWTSDVFKENLTHFTYREPCQHNYIPPKPVQLAFAFVMEYEVGKIHCGHPAWQGVGEVIFAPIEVTELPQCRQFGGRQLRLNSTEQVQPGGVGIRNGRMFFLEQAFLDDPAKNALDIRRDITPFPRHHHSWPAQLGSVRPSALATGTRVDIVRQEGVPTHASLPVAPQ